MKWALITSMFAAVSMLSSQAADIPVLSDSWKQYKAQFIHANGRVIDPAKPTMTTSEAQSYALLRALWMNDSQTFKRVHNWNLANLKRKTDHLFSWKYGANDAGSDSVLDEQPAADADEDIAFALICASRLWKNNAYAEYAEDMLTDIWNSEVVAIGNENYLAAGPWAKDEPEPSLNPSYFAPYEYRVFAEIDKSHPWMDLVNSSYKALNAVSDESALQLPPDWCRINKLTGQITVDKYSSRSNYSYDAMRVPWRISADAIWNKDERAQKYIERLQFLRDSWHLSKTIRASYSPTGVTVDLQEPVAFLGPVLPALAILDYASAQDVEQKLTQLANDSNYYANNWIWFGLALYKNAIPKPPASPAS